MKAMFQLLALCCLIMVVGKAIAQPATNCCDNCTCAYCGDIMQCYNSPGQTPALCQMGGVEDCGINHPTTECETYWQNNTKNVGGIIRNYPSDPGDIPENCIPIDGGLGFLIAGGLGIGVVGIRRRKAQPLFKQT